ncbi:MAG: DUF3145 domain-containing protein [Actinobacteria bacterium]|nr:DUF3145 domain-containing protein [Actinomycetota bacterium]
MSAHVSWALERVLDSEVNLEFTPQPALEGALRCEYAWHGTPGTGSRIATELRAFPGLRFEVTEDPTPGADGERYSCTPELGIFRATIATNGDVLVGEEQLREMLGRSMAASILGEEFNMEDELELLMGRPWDDELEPFRHAGDGAPVRWLNQVG